MEYPPPKNISTFLTGRKWMPSTASVLLAMRCRNIYPLAFLALWHFANSPTDIGGFFFFGVHHLRILVWFGRGVYMRLNQSRTIRGNERTTILKIACTFCIFAFSTDSKVRKCRKCKGVYEISVIMPHALFALLHTLKMPKCQECQGVIMKTIMTH